MFNGLRSWIFVITNWSHIQHDKKWSEDVKHDIHSSLQPVVNKRSTYTMEMEMALPNTEDRLGNTNSWRPTSIMPAGLPEEVLGETHSEKDNLYLGHKQYTQRRPALQIRSRLLSRPPPFPSCPRDSTGDGHRYVHVIVGCTATLLHSQAVLETAPETGTDV